MSPSENKKGCTISFSGPMITLFCVFLTLKLTGVVSWSWIWVTGPLWMPLILLFLAFFTIKLFAILLQSTLNKYRHRW